MYLVPRSLMNHDSDLKALFLNMGYYKLCALFILPYLLQWLQQLFEPVIFSLHMVQVARK